LVFLHITGWVSSIGVIGARLFAFDVVAFIAKLAMLTFPKAAMLVEFVSV